MYGRTAKFGTLLLEWKKIILVYSTGHHTYNLEKTRLDNQPTREQPFGTQLGSRPTCPWGLVWGGG
eukprot:SAG31_NODE_11117_length_1064_cov_1.295337_2_plen_65_part_01